MGYAKDCIRKLIKHNNVLIDNINNQTMNFTSQQTSNFLKLINSCLIDIIFKQFNYAYAVDKIIYGMESGCMNSFVCKCGSTDVELRDNKMHKGIYCKKCNKWIKWASQNDVTLLNRQIALQEKTDIPNEQIRHIYNKYMRKYVDLKLGSCSKDTILEQYHNMCIDLDKLCKGVID